jgi:hypothetical protein
MLAGGWGLVDLNTTAVVGLVRYFAVAISCLDFGVFIFVLYASSGSMAIEGLLADLNTTAPP